MMTIRQQSTAFKEASRSTAVHGYVEAIAPANEHTEMLIIHSGFSPNHFLSKAANMFQDKRSLNFGNGKHFCAQIFNLCIIVSFQKLGTFIFLHCFINAIT